MQITVLGAAKMAAVELDAYTKQAPDELTVKAAELNMAAWVRQSAPLVTVRLVMVEVGTQKLSWSLRGYQDPQESSSTPLLQSRNPSQNEACSMHLSSNGHCKFGHEKGMASGAGGVGVKKVTMTAAA